MTATNAEILSQPDVWRTAATTPAPGLAAPGERVLAVGCGTSAFVALAYAVLREQAGLGETDWGYGLEAPFTRPYDRVVVISRSGTTTEVIDVLRALPDTTTVLITAVEDSPAGELADEVIVLGYADETSVVQTRFPTTVLTLIRAACGYDVEGSIVDGIAAVTEPGVDPRPYRHFVFLGTGWTVGLAHEAALKIRESAQTWSESYPAMEYRHGPVAVATEQTLVWIFGPAPAGLVETVEATGATVHTGTLDPLAELVLAQRLAVDLATHRGLDPDHPRALSRSIILS
ncbi:MAG: SIS domain-containing protein [Propionibacteriaceae bacterium]